MRNNRGQFIKGHKVLEKWKKKWSLERTGKPNPKNKYPRTEKQLEFLKTINLGRIPWNKGIGKVRFICANCNEEVFDKPYRRKKFCSKECRNVYLHIMRGELHWNYEGKNNRSQRSWSKYREWHKKVLKRDNYICQVCKKRGGELQAHHRKSFAKHLKLRFIVDNGLTVHRICHLKVLHKWKIK